MPISVIGSSERLEALYQPDDGDTLLITFNGMGSKADGKTFSGADLARKLGMPALGIMTRESNWFPEPDMQALLPSIQAYLDRHPKRISYGFSMGGYGAIKYSRMLGVDAVVAMSPQVSIDPDFVPWDRRYQTNVRDFHQGERIRSTDIGGDVYLIADLLEGHDKRHVEIVSAMCTPHVVNAAGVGHFTYEIFLSTEAMGQLFKLVIAGDRDGVRRLVRQRRRTLPDMGSRLWTIRSRQLYDAKRFHQARRAAERSLDGDFQTPDSLLILAKSKLAETKESVRMIVQQVEDLLGPEDWRRRELTEVKKIAVL